MMERVSQEIGRSRRGFTLVEVMVATFLLVVVFAGLTAIYTRGRTQMDYEEDRRKATAVLQTRLDSIRRDFTFATLGTLDGTNLVVQVLDGGRNIPFTVHHEVVEGAPEPHAATIDLTVTWTARTQSGNATRTMTCTTILGRGEPWT